MNFFQGSFFQKSFVRQSLLLVTASAVALGPVGAAPAGAPAGSRPADAKTAGTNAAPRVTRPMLIDLEKSMDSRVARLSQDNPFVLLGPTRGIYLDGYGAVFTAEINLVSAPAALMMFRPQLTKEEIEQHRQLKLARVPLLKQAMRQAMIDSASSLDPIPSQEQIVVVAMLSKYPWENTTGIPQQIMMQASKKDLLEQRNNANALAAIIRTTEN
jgi:hypothetical protein